MCAEQQGATTYVGVPGSNGGLPWQVAAAEKVALGLHLGAYSATRFKAKPKTSPLAQVELLNLGGGDKATAAVQRAADLAKGIILSRCPPLGSETARRGPRKDMGAV